MILRNIPNFLTITRFFLVFPTTYYLFQQEYLASLLCFFAAALTDVLDGFLARYFNWSSVLGSILDALADKVLLTSAYFVLGWMGLVPVWLVFIIISRDALLVGGYFWLYSRNRVLESRPSVVGKLSTLSQILLVIVVIVGQLDPRFSFLSNVLIATVLVFTIASGWSYFSTFRQLAK